MASALKRKRGLVEVKDGSKKVKTIKESVESIASTIHPQYGWDAAFNPPTTTQDLLQRNSINGTEPRDFDYYSQRTSHQRDGTNKADLKKKSRPKSTLPHPKPKVWTVSEPIGGRMINVEPVFSEDEQFLIVANPTTINIYSTTTSLLTRSIKPSIDSKVRPDARIITFCLSPTNADLLWVACSDGAIYCIDWTSGSGADDYWSISSTGCIHMTVASMLSCGRQRDVVFTTEIRRDGGWRITANELAPPTGPIQTVARTIYTSTGKINYMKTAKEGTVIAATSGKKVLIGVLRSDEYDTVDKIKYEFKVFESTDFISSLDIRVYDRSSAITKIQTSKVPSPKRLPVVDIVVGDVKGVIFLHSDLWFNLGVTKKGTPGISLIPRKLHWHRQTVHTVKFSRDGNYIISGGRETVLVLWQIDTGKHQFLPHLGSTIQNIVVSPSGSSYGIQLSDNSTMVLSVAELKPTANIAGIQASVISYEDPKDRVRRIGEHQHQYTLCPRVPATISMKDPSRLLIGVGSMQEIDSKKPARQSSVPFLQTFDIAYGRNLSRQPLTRTNITNITTAGANIVSEPRVTHIKLSSDGNWLATVDEWTPPQRDTDFLKHSGSNYHEEPQCHRRREVFLKFWHWSEELQSWQVVSRINNPHASNDLIGAPQILDIAADPSSQQFASIGGDGVVRIWSAKVRKRDGLVMRAKSGDALWNWTCQRAISISKPGLDGSQKYGPPVPNGSIAFSEDGSLLAAACGSHDQGLLHLLDPALGTIRRSQTRMFEGSILKLEFLGQDLITLSDRILVYDIVLDDVRYSLKFKPAVTSLTLQQKIEMIHLAVDRKSQTFAVALPAISTEFSAESIQKLPLTTRYSELAVFHQDQKEPIHQSYSTTLITALLPAINSDGYLVLDSAAEVRTVLPQGGLADTTLAQSTSALQLDQLNDSPEDLIPATEEDEVMEEEEQIDEKMEGIFSSTPVQDDDDEENEIPVVTQQQLSEIFDVGPSFALPPLEELFYQVVGLFSSKPSTKSV